jgi:hypothetical protein
MKSTSEFLFYKQKRVSYLSALFFFIPRQYEKNLASRFITDPVSFASDQRLITLKYDGPCGS